MNIPKKIDIYGKEFEIVLEKGKSRKGADGEFDAEHSRISLCADIQGFQLKSAFLHELFHGVLNRIGANQALPDEVEEIIVEALSVFVCETFNISMKKK